MVMRNLLFLLLATLHPLPASASPACESLHDSSLPCPTMARSCISLTDDRRKAERRLWANQRISKKKNSDPHYSSSLLFSSFFFLHCLCCVPGACVPGVRLRCVLAPPLCERGHQSVRHYHTITSQSPPHERRLSPPPPIHGLGYSLLDSDRLCQVLIDCLGLHQTQINSLKRNRVLVDSVRLYRAI